MPTTTTDAYTTDTYTTDAYTIDLRPSRVSPDSWFEVLLRSGKTIRVERADAYQPEGPLTTFFVTGSSRLTIDSWSTRVASYRTAEIVAIQRKETATSADSSPRRSLAAA